MLPAGWKEMAEATHGGFDGLAAAVRAARGPAAARDSALAHAARVTASCSGCHETYRLSLAPAAAR
jgi:cytochrome c556